MYLLQRKKVSLCLASSIDSHQRTDKGQNLELYAMKWKGAEVSKAFIETIDKNNESTEKKDAKDLQAWHGTR